MSLGRVVSRILPVALLTLPLLGCSGSWVALLAQAAASQEASKSFVAWAREHAIPIATIEPGRGFEDLQPLQEIIGNARIVGLGESVHGAHEFFQVRHRLLEFLVEAMGFTAFAMETGFAEAVGVNEYVLGRREEPERWRYNWFAPGFGAETELRALVRWMRRYNEDPTHSRKLHFYGLDVHARISNPLAAIEAAWAYLDEVDSDYAAQSRQALLPLVEPFLGQGGGVRGVSLDKYIRLSMEARNAYAAAIADFVARFEARQVDYLRRSSDDAYQWAYRHAIVARQLDDGFRAIASAGIPPEDSPYPAEGLIARDRAMADNLLWALEREGPEGRIVLWAHNGHLQKYALVHGYMNVDMNVTRLGEFLDSMIGDDYVSVGFTYYQGADSGWASYQTDIPNPPRPASLDAALARVGLPMFVLDLRSVPREGLAYEWLNQVRGHRMSVPEYLELNPLQAWDALFHIDRISPVQLEAAPK